MRREPSLRRRTSWIPVSWILATLGLALLGFVAPDNRAASQPRGLSQFVQFVDQGIDNKTFPQKDPKYQAWTAQEKSDFMRHLEAAYEKGPHLITRVAAVRPVRVLRISEYRIATWYMLMQSENYSLTVTDKAAKDMAGAKLHPFAVATIVHEMTHLLDFAREFAWDKEWIKLIKPRLDYVQYAFRERTGRGLADYFEFDKQDPKKEAIADSLARAQGLPRGYSAHLLHEALAECTAHLVTNPKYVPAEAIASYLRTKLLVAAPADEITRLTHEGLMALEKGDKTKANTAFSAAIKLNPQFALAYYWRSFTSRYIETALGDLDRVVALSPEVPVYVFNDRGMFWLRLQRPEKAWIDYGEALKRKADVPAAKKGKEQAFDRIVDNLLHSSNEAVRLQAAKFLGKLGADATKALPALKGAVTDPDADVRLVAAASLRRIQSVLDNPPRKRIER